MIDALQRHLALAAGCGMGTVYDKAPSWWGGNIDSAGTPIREDVSDAAQNIWPIVCREVQASLHDTSEAAELLEKSVCQISRYLNKQGAKTRDTNPPGLLLTAVRRALLRKSRKADRVVAVGSGLDTIHSAPSWENDLVIEMFFEQLLRRLSPQGGKILTLRRSGYGWKEISEIVQIPTLRLKTRFWREIGQVRKNLGIRSGRTRKTD